jgi:hypothetical protein
MDQKQSGPLQLEGGWRDPGPTAPSPAFRAREDSRILMTETANVRRYVTRDCSRTARDFRGCSWQARAQVQTIGEDAVSSFNPTMQIRLSFTLPASPC